MTTRQPIAVLEGVTRRYGPVTALDQLSLEIWPGETVALLGPNGAGKTTAVETLLGLNQPDAGTVRVFELQPADAIAAGRVGAMLQDAGLPQDVTAAELIRLVARLYPAPLSVDDTLRLTDLTAVSGRQVQRLSGGQRERVRLAMAVVGHPELLVLDEPTGALDVEARRTFWNRVDALRAESRTVLYTTHRLEEADIVADRVVVVSQGRVLADGTPDEVKAAAAGRSIVRVAAAGLPREALDGLPAVETVEAGQGRFTLHTTDPDRTVRALLERAPAASGLEVTRAGLEEAFLALTRQEEEEEEEAR